MTRFVHTADWQLGMTRHFLSPEAQSRFTAARIDAVRSIGALADAEGCAHVLVCGDVFETNHVERQVVVRTLDAMAATPDVTFHLLPGNHDPLDASSVFRSRTFTTHQPANVVVLDSPGPHTIEPGVELVAAPWVNKRPLADLVAQAVATPTTPGTLRIAVGHGAVDELSPNSTNPALISVGHLEAAIDAGALHYVALGDRHSTTDVGRTGRIRYAGAPEPTDFIEVDAGNALVVDVTADTIDVTAHRIGTWSFLAAELEVTGAADLAQITALLGPLPDKARTIVKLALVGHLSLAETAQLEELLDHHRDLLAALETWEYRNDLVVLPDADDLTCLDLSGFARDALLELRDLAVQSGGTTGGGSPEQVVARDALGLLYRLGRTS